MNGIKAVAKVVAATAASAVMLGATVAGAAFAADFGGFPAPFVADGTMAGKVVVGANAQTADVVGAIGIAAALGQAAWMTGAATGTGTATVTVASADGVKGEVKQGQDVYDATDFTGKLPLKNNRFAALHKWTGDDLKYKDNTSYSVVAEQMIVVDTNSMEISHGETDAAAGKWYLKVPAASMHLNMTLTTYDETYGKLVFDLFGKEITLESVGVGSMTLSAGSKYAVSLDSPTFTDSASGATVTFKGVNTDSNKAYVTVTNGGVTETAVLDSDTAKTVAGIELKATDLFRMSDTSMFGSVTVGSKLSDSISTGEKFLGASDWELYDVGGTASTLTYFTVAYMPTDTKYLSVGESLSGLFAGFDVSVQDPVVSDSGYTAKITAYKDDAPNVFHSAATKSSTGGAFKITFPKADVAQLANGTDVRNDGASALYFYENTTTTPNAVVTYMPDATDASAASYVLPSNVTAYILNLTYGDTKVIFSFADAAAGTTGNLTVLVNSTIDAGAETLLAQYTLDANGIATLAQGTSTDPLGGDLFYTGGFTSATGIGAFEYQYITDYGVKLDAPKESLKSPKKVAFTVPNQLQKQVVVLGKDTTVKEQIAAGATGPLSGVKIDAISVSGAQTATKVPITAPIAVLDTEVASATADNLILVGGPSVNTLVKQLGGMYADANTYKDVGKLFFVSNAFGGAKTAVVAAGWDADNTRAASYVLAHYDSYATTFAGKTELTVNGKDVTSLTVA